MASSSMENGFTLIEVLLASFILALIGTMTFSSLFATFKTQKTIDDRTELQEVGTASITKIRDDLTQAFFVESARTLTVFKGEHQADKDRLEFSTMTHSPANLESKESDQTLVTYMTESMPGEAGLFRLRRRETRFLTDRPERAGDFVTLAERVVAFTLEYNDGQNFKNTWDTKAVETLNRLPKLVRVTLKLRDERGREETYETITDIAMQDGLSVVSQTTQIPGGIPTPLPSPTPVRTP